VFDEHGFHTYRTDARSEISSPRDGSIDSHGGFVFIDTAEGNGRTIRRLNFLGEPETYYPEIPRSSNWSPRHLLITGDGHYVTVDRSGLLAKHDDRTGALVWKLQLVETEWEGSDLLGRPAEAPDGRIYVPNTRLGQIEVVSRNGELLTAFGIPGTKRGELSFPVGVAFEPEGRILVLDRMRHVVLVFDSNHRFLSESGRVGFAPGDFYHPVAIAASSDGLVYVAQGFEGRIQVFRLLDTASGEGALPTSEPAVKRGNVSE
jgi:hypothetical protein